MSRTNLTKFMTALIIVSVLSGCKTSAPLPVTSDPATPSASTPVIGTEGMATYEQIQATVNKLDKDATAQELADTLTAISAVRVPDADKSRVSKLEVDLLTRLRDKVTSEVSALHQGALKSDSYADGYSLARDAASKLALYPLSDEADVVKEAEDLSMRQKEVLMRLDLIRRQRYNYWAAGQVEKALRQLRESGVDGMKRAIEDLSVIEPSLLESSVASVYSYVVTELMDNLKKHEKAIVAKKLTGPSVSRRNLENF